MFGFLTVRGDLLTDEQQQRYRACYCGLCRSLRSRHGLAAGLTLNYDITFLILLLSSLYEPDEDGGSNVCLVHPFTPRDWTVSHITDYAADMNVALARLNCADDWKDDSNLLAAAEGALLDKAYNRISLQYPRQIGVAVRALDELDRIEKSGEALPDQAADCFGRLMGEMFVLYEDRWAEPLRAMGEALGRFIYTMDAVVDLEKDMRHKSYNPFSNYFGRPDNAEVFRDILEMLMGDCVRLFDYLPLVNDVGLMQNILCAGLWAGFNEKYSQKKESSQHESGSV